MRRMKTKPLLTRAPDERGREGGNEALRRNPTNQSAAPDIVPIVERTNQRARWVTAKHHESGPSERKIVIPKPLELTIHSRTFLE